MRGVPLADTGVTTKVVLCAARARNAASRFGGNTASTIGMVTSAVRGGYGVTFISRAWGVLIALVLVVHFAGRDILSLSTARVITAGMLLSAILAAMGFFLFIRRRPQPAEESSSPIAQLVDSGIYQLGRGPVLRFVFAHAPDSDAYTRPPAGPVPGTSQ